MSFLDTIKEFPYLFFSIRTFIVGVLGVIYVYLSSIYSELKIFRNKDFVFLGFSLPIIGCAITTVIGTNIALSLGMVGALSIIRFRTPVRSPYELILYFALLTMGITMSVNFKYTLILFISLISFKLFYHLVIQKISKPFLKNKFSKDKTNVNFTIHLKKNELSNFLNENDYTKLACDNIENNMVELNFYKTFKDKTLLENFLTNNKDIIKNFIIDEN